MAEQTRVYLITGFLGSGKTTFLNRVIAKFPKNRKLMILMNEFGEIGIDGTLVETEELEMMEISRGSIFCVCVKSDFIKGLYEVAQKIAPDVMIIESTGVANPSDLKRDLMLPIFKGRYQFVEQFCLLDAHNFMGAYGAYASIEKQIASSTLFILNKVDLSSREAIEEIKGIVREYHNNPEFHEATYADIPFERFFFPEEAAVELASAQASAPKGLPPLSDEDLDRAIDSIIQGSLGEMTPPDVLMSAVYQWTGDDLSDFSRLAGKMPSGILRCKGFVFHSGRIRLFSFVMGDWSLDESTVPPERIRHKNVLVFIGSPEAIEALAETAAGDRWIQLGTLRPGRTSAD
jgi:G3E family GTPase